MAEEKHEAGRNVKLRRESKHERVDMAFWST
jgi:hypothetical protein